MIEDCCCRADEVTSANHEHFRPLLRDLVRTQFFRYFKVDMHSECPFWQEDFQCSQQDCAVHECAPDEVPAPWRASDMEEMMETGATPATAANPLACGSVGGLGEAAVLSLSELDAAHSTEGVDFTGWQVQQEMDAWTSQRAREEELTYVHLLRNPERFTGYQGQHIWQAVYGENCFRAPLREPAALAALQQQPAVGAVNPLLPADAASVQPACLEERVFFRLLSGLHASINTHIAREYKFPDGSWGPNVDLYVERVGRHPQRLSNLYFAYLFLMRAVVKSRELLLSHDFDTGDVVEDARTKALMEKLLDPSALSRCDPVVHGFNESQLFAVPDGLSPMAALSELQQKRHLREDFKLKFQNISRILDCVGCDKCRVWGKLQVLGLGTAFKLLYAEDTQHVATLARNELIALVNLFDRLAQSVDTIQEMRDLEFQRSLRKSAAIVLPIGVLAVVSILLLVRRWMRQSHQASTAKKGN